MRIWKKSGLGLKKTFKKEEKKRKKKKTFVNQYS